MNNILNLNKYGNTPNSKNWTQSDKNHTDPKDSRITCMRNFEALQDYNALRKFKI